ncbi:MgtC/SapB family protein [Glaciimonas sp. PAMC28666]|uniref:MgtC/SapB family protein n=1 Tax=Glaciimonas sp. PAMC28666 TaxID=2807626 RepID=UPI001965B170|nr:MgtC/SapB family protein [Glaciimonas sp. PAMC28666]QRX81494.1 MgtC/SapB family protein [Glaciimonas sp. PAMC28666]
MGFGEIAGQGWLQIGELGLAFVLSALIGMEREMRQKSAGLRTHTLVGLGAALIMLISKYGFTDVLSTGLVVVDPSRVAAQVVSGIGFIGGGLIFVRRDSVRGLTTAAIVWLTASVGMACGAGLPILAVLATAAHFVVVFTFPHIALRLPKSRWAPSVLQISYEDGRDVLRDVLLACTQHDFSVSRLKVERPSDSLDSADPPAADGKGMLPAPDVGPALTGAQAKRIATVVLEVQGVKLVSKLADRLSTIPGVVSVHAGDVNIPSD